MGFIINSIADIFLSLIRDLLLWFMGIYAKLHLNIGDASDKIGNYFDKIFPNASTFTLIFGMLALFLIVGLTTLKTIQSIMGPLSDKSEHPVAIAFQFILAMTMAALSYQIFKYVQTMADSIYQLFKEAATVNNEKLTEAGMKFLSGDQLIEKSEPIFTDLVVTAVLIVAMFALLIEFVKVSLEMFERYVMLGLLYYTCPLPFVALVSRNTSPIFSAWIRMVFSQFILLFLNLFFIGVFIGGFTTLMSGVQTRGYVFETKEQFIITFFIFIAWLKIAQRVDQHMQSLGLSTAQAGGGLWGALLGGVAGYRATKGVVRGMGNLANMPLKVADKGRNLKAAGGKVTSKTEAIRRGLDDAGVMGGIRAAAGITSDKIVREHGRLTPEGLKKALGDKKRTGLEAKEATLGIMGKDQLNRDIYGRDGKPLKDKIDWENVSMGDGQIHLKDKAGKTLQKITDLDTYTYGSEYMEKSAGMVEKGGNGLNVGYSPSREEVLKDARGVAASLQGDWRASTDRPGVIVPVGEHSKNEGLVFLNYAASAKNGRSGEIKNEAWNDGEYIIPGGVSKTTVPGESVNVLKTGGKEILKRK